MSETPRALPTPPSTGLTPAASRDDFHHAVRSSNGVILIPQPSVDPKDPLNWSAAKKHGVFAVVCLAVFVGTANINVQQLAYIQQTSYYHKSPVQLSYSISAGVAGLIVGPILLVPLASVIGRASLIFWCSLVSLGCNVWGPLMTGSNDYIPFVLSRLFAGLFGSVPAQLASGYIMDLYFLHQRGKAFTVLEVCIFGGILVAPVLGGFIANSKPWPFVFWWLVAVSGLSVILTFLLLEETSYSRENPALNTPRPQSYVANRICTFLPGTKTIPRTTFRAVARKYAAPFLIAFSPVTLFAGFFITLVFGFVLGLGVESAIFLQTPVAYGGYGFTPLQNATFNTSWWCAVIACQLCGIFLNDRVPLWISRRSKGIWHSENRLWTIFLVIFAAPVGLGLFGAGLQYHLHYMVLALGTFLTIFAAIYSIPITINYITECFPDYPLEVAVCMNAYRNSFGLGLTFYEIPWQAAVGSGWLFGTQAFICIFASIFICVLIWKGHVLRRYKLLKDSDEDGLKITTVDSCLSIFEESALPERKSMVPRDPEKLVSQREFA
ncbi:MAG: hypothetical protein MMC33_009765 [Icmadophila ericetorum]|nr:hypothetical protein [Icmadophila ericetorum]